MSNNRERRSAKQQEIRDAYKQEASVIFIPAVSPDTCSDKKLRVAAYCRVSTDSETQAISFELQRQEYEEKIKKDERWEFVGIYADEGMSGLSAKKRKQFRQMIDDCREGKIDLILVKNVSRFMRNSVECMSYTRELGNLVPPVGILLETENIDTRKSGYELQLGLHSLFAQSESENKSQSIIWSNERYWKKGIARCNTKQFFGYRKNENARGKMDIDPEQALLIRSIYKQFSQGKNIGQITKCLTEKKIPAFYGGTWSQSSVRNILKNEVYCGDVIRPKRCKKDFLSTKSNLNTGQRNKYHIKDHHAAIIDRKTWRDVQEQLKFRRYARSEPKKSLSIQRMTGALNAFYLLDPSWDGYDLERVRKKLFPRQTTDEQE